jgi:hypothetical protein
MKLTEGKITCVVRQPVGGRVMAERKLCARQGPAGRQSDQSQNPETRGDAKLRIDYQEPIICMSVQRVEPLTRARSCSTQRQGYDVPTYVGGDWRPTTCSNS